MNSVLEMALEALKYHREQTRAIALSDTAIFALEEAIKNQGEPVVSYELWRFSFPDSEQAARCAFNIAAARWQWICKLEQEALKNQGEPVAWRYRNANGVYRYRGYVPDFDKTHAILKPIPLYTSAPTIPEGWQLVPVAPTPKMIHEGQMSRLCPVTGSESAAAIYKAMLSAAPKGEQP